MFYAALSGLKHTRVVRHLKVKETKGKEMDESKEEKISYEKE